MTKDTGIVLRSSPFRERDRLVHLLTEHHGKISGIAKGAIHSRRFGGSLDLFNCIEIEFVDKPNQDLVRIDSATIREGFPEIRKSLEGISAASYFVDLVRHLTEERLPAPGIFKCLAHYLHLIARKPLSAEIIRSFEIKLLDHLGYTPITNYCVLCNANFFANPKECQTQIFYFSVENGGVTCANCSNEHPPHQLNWESLIWINTVRTTKIQDIPDLIFSLDAIATSANFLRAFIQYHCPGLNNYSFQSHSMLESFLVDCNAQATASPRSSAT